MDITITEDRREKENEMKARAIEGLYGGASLYPFSIEIWVFILGSHYNTGPCIRFSIWEQQFRSSLRCPTVPRFITFGCCSLRPQMQYGAGTLRR